MKFNPTKFRLASISWLKLWPIMVLGAGLLVMQYFYTVKIRAFRKAEIKGVISSIDKLVGAKGRVSFSIKVRLKNGDEFNLNNGLEAELLGFVSIGDTLFKKAGESEIFVVNRGLRIDVIDQGPWKK